MSSSARERPKLLLEDLTSCMLKDVNDLRIEVSSDLADYTIFYVAEKLVCCTSALSKLGDLAASISLWAIEVAGKMSQLKTLIAMKSRDVKSRSDWKSSTRDEREFLLYDAIKVYQEELDDWELVRVFLSELRILVTTKSQLIKRIDSDLRLQEKLIEASTGKSGVAARRQLAATSQYSSDGGSEIQLED